MTQTRAEGENTQMCMVVTLYSGTVSENTSKSIHKIATMALRGTISELVGMADEGPLAMASVIFHIRAKLQQSLSVVEQAQLFALCQSPFQAARL